MKRKRNKNNSGDSESSEDNEIKKNKMDDYESSNDDNSINDDSSIDEDSSLIDTEDLDDVGVINEDEVKRSLTKSVLNKMIDDISSNKKININKFLSNLEKNITKSEEDLENEKNIIKSSAIEITNSIIRSIISEIKYEMDLNKNFKIKDFLYNKIDLLDEIDEILNQDRQLREPKENNFVLKLMMDPMKYVDQGNNEQYMDQDYNPDDEIKNKYDKKFLKFLENGVITPKDDLKYFKDLPEEHKIKYLEDIEKLKDMHKVEKPKMLNIIDQNTSWNNKSVIINKFQNFDMISPYSSEYFKLKNWVEGISKIPFGVFKEAPVKHDSKRSDIKKYLKKVKKHMDDAVYSHDNAKRQILQSIAHTISNPEDSGSIIAIQGPPGVGKTQLIQDGISKALDRPFEFISLGGAQDSSFLEGHDYTYEGSRWGKIVDVLMKSKCMNPVILFDELDKVSETPKGEEIINVLTHLTDLTQNHHFHDKYFSGIDFDLSKAIFIFSFNDESRINRVLKDRMYVIRTGGYQIQDKINIAKDYLIPNLIKSIGFSPEEEVQFNEDIIKFIVDRYTFEGGVRKLKECLLEILKEINLRRLDGSKLLDSKIRFPLKIEENMITKDLFQKRHTVTIEKIHPKSKIGLVNGLWANDLGTGGLIPIEAFSIPTMNKLELELTGMQGDVMRESMSVAKTVAWNILPDNCKNALCEEWKNFGCTGIHIHCPDGSTPKDGPSAGAAITTCIVSLLLKQKVNNEVAMTGEINLKGEVTEIGGLAEKLDGAKKAGAKHVLIPKNNIKDLEKIKLKSTNLIDNNFKVTPVSNIWEVMKIVFFEDVKTVKY